MIERVHPTITGETGAIFSDCEKYRYRLWRQWDKSLPSITFLMLNPSTADELNNDPTVQRCEQRAIAGNFGRLDVVNLFPLRSTDPAGLNSSFPLGPGTAMDRYIVEAVQDAAIVVCGWGNRYKPAKERAINVLELISMTGLAHKLHYLSLNKDGSPKHPLYIAMDAKPTPWVFRT